MTACFIPGGNCTDTIIHALSDATRTILVQADAFTPAPMAKARLDAHTGGVQVQIILHKSQHAEQYSSGDFLANQRVPTMIDAEDAISHHKVMMIDGKIVITGRFNLTKAAQEQNPESALTIRGPALAAREARVEVLEATLRRSHNWGPAEVFHRRDGHAAEAAAGTLPSAGRGPQ